MWWYRNNSRLVYVTETTAPSPVRCPRNHYEGEGKVDVNVDEKEKEKEEEEKIEESRGME